ncbi:schlafen-like protein 1 [Anneissia japonica]|uniref:schlafen-like protein 1 n=1 Tax=Anneissia japonica TaxID=1529436 RepID=UPI0014256DF1|nr:schlafen-like protein 1 [Anneissia japonica]
MSTPYGVLMGNLNNAISKRKVCTMIVNVFNYVLGINIAWYNVNISPSHTHKSFTATIFVPNEFCQNLAVITLNESMLPYGLIKEGQRLIIDYFWGNKGQNGGTVLTTRTEINYKKRKKKREEKRTGSQGKKGQAQSFVINSASPGTNEHQSTSNEEELSEEEKTDASNNGNLLELYNNADSIADQLDKVDYLKKNQQLGNETRKLEFKRGDGNYLGNTLKSVLGTYMSAFLNSSGGSLLIGVDDGGLL